jgi:hypothetical protein
MISSETFGGAASDKMMRVTPLKTKKKRKQKKEKKGRNR